jgi:23S rRNA (cytidine1920-2'-O)/16S rRNA (cytidine1409-2'-O)-methyltransferase
MKRERIDKLLVNQGLADSRTKAQALIMAGEVLVDEQRVGKPSEVFAPDVRIRLKTTSNPATRYVSRAGLKLEGALKNFQIKIEGLICLDIGSSTGGFTDCLLQHGARQVAALDAGHNQLDWKLRSDSRVQVREGVNARYLKPDDFDQQFDLVTIDVAFISARKILPVVIPLLKPGGKIMLLIKPQFEVGKGEVGKGGIVKDPAKHERVIHELNDAAEALGLTVSGVMESPIHGADGNVEFLALYEQPDPSELR